MDRQKFLKMIKAVSELNNFDLMRARIIYWDGKVNDKFFKNWYDGINVGVNYN